jgi:hypothetical protein
VVPVVSVEAMPGTVEALEQPDLEFQPHWLLALMEQFSRFILVPQVLLGGVVRVPAVAQVEFPHLGTTTVEPAVTLVTRVLLVVVAVEVPHRLFR